MKENKNKTRYDTSGDFHGVRFE